MILGVGFRDYRVWGVGFSVQGLGLKVGVLGAWGSDFAWRSVLRGFWS